MLKELFITYLLATASAPLSSANNINKNTDKINRSSSGTSVSLTIDSTDAELYNTIEDVDQLGYMTETTNFYKIEQENYYMYVKGNYYLKDLGMTTGEDQDELTGNTYTIYDLAIYEINYYGTTSTNEYNYSISYGYEIQTYDFAVDITFTTTWALAPEGTYINSDLLDLSTLNTISNGDSTLWTNIYNEMTTDPYYQNSEQQTYNYEESVQEDRETHEINIDFTYSTETDWTEYGAPYLVVLTEKQIYFEEIESTGTSGANIPTFTLQTINLPDLTLGSTFTSGSSVYEVVDLPGLLWTILTLPFAFISTAFNLTLFPNTPYQVNIGNVILSIIAILVLIFIIKLIINKAG